MFCSVCGSEISLAAEVCPACGRPVAPSSARRPAAARGAAKVSRDSSGSWAAEGLIVAQVEAPLAPPAQASSTATVAPSAATIYAGDLDLPGFPRELPGRVALLTGLVMTADMLLPWVTVNGAGYAPTRFGLPALALVATLAAVIAPPLIPRFRRATLTRLAPFGVGAFSLGVGIIIWLLSGPLASMLATALVARVENAAAPAVFDGLGDAQLAASTLRIAPAIGLYIFLLGACALLVAGYQQVSASGRLRGR
ncbi:MAG TPA: zinc ribbon domain-containing protein [Ktedonobacterales bacterium]